MLVATSLFGALRAQQQEIHARTLAHPVVRGIGEGSLPAETFRFYLEQDYQFLLRYARVLAHAAAQSDDLPTTRRLAELLHATLATEITALNKLYVDVGGQAGAMEA